MRTPVPDAVSEIEDRGGPRTHNSPAPRRVMPQEAYKTARKQKEFGGLRVIEFYVYGEKGIRLSDALGENWAGLEDRDNRSFFDDDRAQIMIRLHVSLPAIIQNQAPRLTSTTNPPS